MSMPREYDDIVYSVQCPECGAIVSRHVANRDKRLTCHRCAIHFNPNGLECEVNEDIYQDVDTQMIDEIIDNDGVIPI